MIHKVGAHRRTVESMARSFAFLLLGAITVLALSGCGDPASST